MRELTQPYIGHIGNEPASDVFDCYWRQRGMGPFVSEKLFDEWALEKIQCPVSRVCVLGLLHIRYEG